MRNKYQSLDKKLKEVTGDFALIELIVVIFIIGFLFVFSAIGLIQTNRKATNQRVVDDLNFIAVALDDYYRENNQHYPIPDEGQNWIDMELIGERYLKKERIDHHSGNPYAYGLSADGQHYQLAGLQKQKNGNINLYVKSTSDITDDLIEVREGLIYVKQGENELIYPPKNRN